MTSDSSDLLLLLVQHCQSEHHVGDLTGGWTDTPLTEFGRRQAERLASVLSRRLDGQPTRCYSSDLLRASQTAEAIARAIDFHVVLEPDLRERNNGVATGKTKAWAAENAAPRQSQGMDLDRRPFAGAETPREFFGRVSDCVVRLLAGVETHFLLVTHGGTVRAIIAWWLGMSAEQFALTSFDTRAGSITTLSMDGWQRRVLTELGDMSHLDGLVDSITS